jgi:putative lipoic acid-binding regulatory protein
MTKPTTPDPTEEALFEFPCRFPIKAMGRSDEDFEATVVRIVRGHAELWEDDGLPVSSNPSRNGNYVSVTVQVRATSKAQLDAIYQELTDCPGVLMAL